MRIQLNTIGQKKKSYAKELEKIPFIHIPYYSYNKEYAGYRTVRLAFYCEECGAELAGEWAIPECYVYSGDSGCEDAEATKLLMSNSFGEFEEYVKNLKQRSLFVFRGWEEWEDAFEKKFSKICKVFKEIKAEQNALKKEACEMYEMTHCPICGKKLSRKVGYYAAYGDDIGRPIAFKTDEKTEKEYGVYFSDMDSLLAVMQEVRQKNERTNADTKVDKLLVKYEKAAVDKGAPDGTAIKKDAEKLKAYLFNIIQTESGVFSLTKRLKELYLKQFEVNRNAYGSTMYPLLEIKKERDNAQKEWKACKERFELVKKKKPVPPKLPMPQCPAKPIEPYYEKPGFFNRKKIIAQNEALAQEYRLACEKYERDLEQYNKSISQYNERLAQLRADSKRQHEENLKAAELEVEKAEQALARINKKAEAVVTNSADIATPEKAIKELLESEIKQAEKLLKKVVLCKHQLYNCNVVFEKYRNFVAISMFYEYLMCGRCESLEGPNGAYNLYESETRANIIIAQLSNVLESLETIKENQYMIYEAIQSVDAGLCHLNTTMCAAVKSLSSIESKAETMTKYMARIADNSDVMAHNSAVTAYYSKINAELTNALGYMVALG